MFGGLHPTALFHVSKFNESLSVQTPYARSVSAGLVRPLSRLNSDSETALYIPSEFCLVIHAFGVMQS
jgi:hypothetical protein